jgi:hypothetical protein
VRKPPFDTISLTKVNTTSQPRRTFSLQDASGFGPWPDGLMILEDLRRAPAVHRRQIGGREVTHLSRAI